MTQSDRIGEVAWYVTGRFYSTATTLLDVGYFLHLQGIPDKLFAGEMHESAALLTFAAEPFTAKHVTNGGLQIGVDTRGAFRIYLREEPGATFDDPSSFAVGRCVAEFDRVSIVPTVQIGFGSSPVTLLSNVFTANLIVSEPFEIDGTRYDFRDLIGSGITQWGTAATEPLTPPPQYAGVVPFVGSAIRIGSR